MELFGHFYTWVVSTVSVVFPDGIPLAEAELPEEWSPGSLIEWGVYAFSSDSIWIFLCASTSLNEDLKIHEFMS